MKMNEWKKWMKMNEKWMKMNKNEWKWTKMNENERNVLNESFKFAAQPL